MNKINAPKTFLLGIIIILYQHRQLITYYSIRGMQKNRIPKIV